MDEEEDTQGQQEDEIEIDGLQQTRQEQLDDLTLDLVTPLVCPECGCNSFAAYLNIDTMDIHLLCDICDTFHEPDDLIEEDEYWDDED